MLVKLKYFYGYLPPGRDLYCLFDSKTLCFDGNSILPRESSIADGMHYLVAVIKYFSVRNLHPFTLFRVREMVLLLG